MLDEPHTAQIEFLAHGLCTAPPFDVLGPLSRGYSGTDNSYLYYLPRFQAIWAAMRRDTEFRGRGTRFHASFLDTWRLKVALLPQELELFAGVLYAHGLLVQVVYEIAGRNGYALANDENKENTFPRVNGVLSTIDMHVCPAIMPAILLYEEVRPSPSREDLNTYSSINPRLEQNIWLEKSALFDKSVEGVIQNIDALLPILLKKSPAETRGIIKNYQYNHAKISLAISNGVYGDRRINSLGFLE